LDAKHRSLLLDLESCKIKCDKYKQSLKYFDDNFFNEIESLKKRHDEAVKLNKYYEYLLFRGDKDNLILNNLHGDVYHENVRVKNRPAKVEQRVVKFKVDDKQRDEVCDSDEYQVMADSSLDLLRSLNSDCRKGVVNGDDGGQDDYDFDFDGLTRLLNDR
jgi:hypothetical protein